MIKKIIIIYLFVFVIFAQSSFQGLDTWAQANAVSLSGSGYIMPFRNDFRNAAMLVDSNRFFSADAVSYPAGISGQSLRVNSKIKGHFLGFKISRTGYGIFSQRNMENEKTGEYSASDVHFQIGYAKATQSGKIIVGANSGLFISNIQSYNAKAITLSPAVIFNSRIAKLGLSFHNYGKLYRSYTNNKENLPTVRVVSISRNLPNTGLELEVDHIFLSQVNKEIVRISGLLELKSGLFIKSGLSSNRFDQQIDNPTIRNLISDLGFGIAYATDDFIIDLGTYSYGPGGHIIGFGISSKF